MKAYIIKSTEYKHNEPSVFVFANGEYFGDLVYPTRDKMPQDINHWRTATCADSDRWFHVTETEITEEQVSELRRLHKELDENSKHFVPYTPYRPGLTKQEEEEDLMENMCRDEINRPYFRKESELRASIEEIINSLNVKQEIVVHNMRYVTLKELEDQARPYLIDFKILVAHRGEVYYDEIAGGYSFDSNRRISNEKIGYYGFLTTKDFIPYSKFLSVEEFQEHAKKYSRDYRNKQGLYYTNFDRMAFNYLKRILLVELLLDIKAQ